MWSIIHVADIPEWKEKKTEKIFEKIAWELKIYIYKTANQRSKKPRKCSWKHSLKTTTRRTNYTLSKQKKWNNKDESQISETVNNKGNQ